MPPTSNYGYTYDFGFWIVIAGAYSLLDVIELHLRGDCVGERQINKNLRARIVSWCVTGCLQRGVASVLGLPSTQSYLPEFLVMS